MSGDSLGNDPKWQTLPDMLNPHVFPATTIIKDTIFVIAGCEQSGQPKDFCESFPIDKIYDASAKWTALPGIPIPRAGTQLVCVGDKIYTMGGVGAAKSTIAAVDEFDPAAQKWLTVAQLPQAVQGCAVTVRQNKIIVAGGMGADTVTYPTFSCFDPNTGKLAPLPEMPHARYAAGKLMHNDVFYIFGGRNGRNPIPECDAFDFRAFKWRSLPDMPSHCRVFPNFVYVDGHVLCMGGLDPTNVTGGFSTLCHSFHVETETWTQKADLLIGRADAAVFALADNTVLLAAGFDNTGKPSGLSHRYKLETSTWEQYPDMISTHLSCGYASTDSLCVVTGGIKDTGVSSVAEFLPLAF